MQYIIGIGIIIAAGVIISAFALCKISGEDDRRNKR